MHEACGIFGVYAPGEDVSRITFFGLFALQHRGQESAGIATSDGKSIQVYAKLGLVSQVFSEDSLSQLVGNIAIGHNRYSTTGSGRSCDVQPVVVGRGDNRLAVAHNGNLINAEHIKRELLERGYTFSTSTDSEIIALLILSAPSSDLIEKIRYAIRRIKGAYSLVIMTKDQLFAIRDSFGVRPLCMGRINGHWVIASESCALDHIGAYFVRDIQPGEIVAIDSNGPVSYREPVERKATCIFEYIYFARPDSIIDGRLVYEARLNMGVRLALEHPVKADLVAGVPDSATIAGIGYAQESCIPHSEVLIKNRYVGRTFIAPDQRMRDLGVRLKFNPLPGILNGKSIVLVDDSIVRGTTTPKVINLLRKAGAKEVHIRICAPPLLYPCFFGVDMASRRELIAAQKTEDEVRRFIGADSLGYISIEGLIKAIGLPERNFCTACFTGNYPIPVQLEMEEMELKVK